VTIRPGKSLVWSAVALAAVSVLTFFWTPVVWLLAAVAVALAVAAEFERRQLKLEVARLTVNRTLPAVIGRDAPFESTLTVFNTSRVVVDGELRDVLPAAANPRLAIHPLRLSPTSAAPFTTKVRIPDRGRHQFGPVWVRLRGSLGLLEVQQTFDCPGAINVLPETFASRERLQKDVGAEQRLLDQIQRSRQFGTGTEFESLYPYRLGDDPRRIDWRATARQQTLVVRRFQIERHRDVMIVIDTGRLMGADVGRGSKLDCAVDAALNLARVVLASGDRCGIAAFDRQVRGFLPPLAGSTALRTLVESVSGLETQWHESDFTPMLAELRLRQAKRTFLIVISDVADTETSQRLCASLVQLQRQHLVLFAALRTPTLRQVIDEPILEARDAARKAVAFRLIRDRGRALHSLSRGGVHVLDVTPSELTAPLVNQFVDLRQRNLL
jgi:uncharacterized protein (DUF58 family)